VKKVIFTSMHLKENEVGRKPLTTQTFAYGRQFKGRR
jgi:hypothetical protein